MNGAQQTLAGEALQPASPSEDHPEARRYTKKKENMRIIQKCAVPLIFSVNFLFLLFMVYTYLKGCRNFPAYGIGIIGISASFGVLRHNITLKRHGKKLKIMQWVVYLVGILIILIGACFYTCNWNV